MNSIIFNFNVPLVNCIIKLDQTFQMPFLPSNAIDCENPFIRGFLK